MASEKRLRQRERRATDADQGQADTERRRQRTVALGAALVVVAVLALALLVWLMGRGSSAEQGSCPPAKGVATPVTSFDGPPPDCLDEGATYSAVFETDQGTVVARLDTDRTPQTVNDFVYLARNGYYDGTALFRTEAKSGIIQGGSPHTQDNTDTGPGFTIPDEGIPFGTNHYGPGALAMARTPEPDSASGQFFFLANQGGRYLGQKGVPGAGTYVVFGQVNQGLDVLQKIAALDTGNGTPSSTVIVKKVRVVERS